MSKQWRRFRHSKHGGVTNVEDRPDGKPEAHARRRGWIPVYEKTPEQPEKSGESAHADGERSESAADTTNEES